MTFDYLERVVVEGQLEVDDIGQCVIQANNDLGEDFYLIVKTELGWTELLEYGPCVPDLTQLPMNYNIKYTRFEYNQGKIERAIDKFLNDPKRGITQAKLAYVEDIREFLVNPVDRVFPFDRGLFDD